jgi:hypothetical protein
VFVAGPKEEKEETWAEDLNFIVTDDLEVLSWLNIKWRIVIKDSKTILFIYCLFPAQR